MAEFASDVGTPCTNRTETRPHRRTFRPDHLERAKARLTVENPERATRLAALSHVLPPRPSGVLALVDSIASDVVVITHAGLDQYGSFAELAKAVPLRETINVRAWRIPADEIPTGEGERIAWLDEQWVLVNEQVAEAARNPDANQQASATRGTFEPGHGAVEPA